MSVKPKTIFCDIDGTLVVHRDPVSNSKFEDGLELLPGTLEKLMEWDKLGYRIILTTGRKESMRSITEKQLSNLGVFYDQLIMGIGGGDRILINDKKQDGTLTAFAYNLIRDKEGIKNLKL